MQPRSSIHSSVSLFLSPLQSTEEEEMKTYLGDGLYADFDGFQFVLTAEDGTRVLNRVYLEPSVYQAFVEYHDAVLVQHSK